MAKKVDKSNRRRVVFAESKLPTTFENLYNINSENVPDGLRELQKQILKLKPGFEKAMIEYNSLYAKIHDYRLSGNVSYNQRQQDEMYQRLMATNDEQQAKYINVRDRYDKLLTEFHNSDLNPRNAVGDRDDTFVKEASKLKSLKGANTEIYPVYGNQDTTFIKDKLSSLNPNDDVVLMGHQGSHIAGLPLKWWDKNLSKGEQENCYLGSCFGGEKTAPSLPSVKNLHTNTDKSWWGVNPYGKDMADAMFSVIKKDSISPNPIIDKDYEIANKTVNAMGTKGNIKRKPKKFLGAAAIIGGAIQLGTSVYKGVQQKKLAEKQAANEAELAGQAVNLGVSNSRNAYSDFIAKHPEMVYGSNKELQAFGQDGRDLRSASDSLTNANKNIPWIDRYLKGNELSITDPINPKSGKTSTHLLSYHPLNDSTAMVYPRIIKEGDGLKYFKNNDEAINHANKNKTGIVTDLELAEFYSKNGLIDHTKQLNAFGQEDPLKSVAEGMQVVEAGTHESGNDLERSNDFVEGGEVVMGENGAVHSNRIDAYSPAQYSASMGVLLDEITQISNRSTGTTKGELIRLGDKVKGKIADVTQKQEAIKDDYSATMDSEGNMIPASPSPMGDISNKPKRLLGVDGDELYPEEFVNATNGSIDMFGNRDFSKAPAPIDTKAEASVKGNVGQYATLGLDLASSLIDNVANARLLKKTPEVPRPRAYTAEPLQTELDVTDQLSGITDQQAKLDALVDASTSSSNTAIQRKRASAGMAIDASNRVIGDKVRQEVQLENREALNEQRVKNMNADLLNQYDQSVVTRENEILSAKSQNVSNLSRDFTDIIDKGRMTQFQNEQLMNDALKYGDTGVMATNALNGNYDGVSATDKQGILNMMQQSGRTADYNALKIRWSL